MPYITFSRNFKEQRSLYRILNGKVRDSVVELRGTKTMPSIARRAASKGFSSVLIINSLAKDSIIAIEVKVTRKDGGYSWRFGKEKKVRMASRGT